eukprot:scaffold166872_cov16-Tisochrysis_lutea.AAC.1
MDAESGCHGIRIRSRVHRNLGSCMQAHAKDTLQTVKSSCVRMKKNGPCRTRYNSGQRQTMSMLQGHKADTITKRSPSSKPRMHDQS